MPRLLIVEDEPRYLELILERLNEAGYTDCDTAQSVEEALDYLQEENNYDVVVGDMRLGGNARGGFEVAYAVRDRNLLAMPYEQAQVIILTANDTVEDAREALRSRPPINQDADPYHDWSICRDYISKTMEDGSALDQLVRAIEQCLNVWGRNAR